MMRKLLPAKELGPKLRRLRKARGWPVGKEFAAKIGKDPAELSRWEKGRVQPEFDTVVNLAKILGVDVSEFMQVGTNGGADPDAELARIDALTDPLLRVLERESYAAVLRAQGVKDVCRATLIEAEKAVDRNALVSSGEDRTVGEIVRRTLGELGWTPDTPDGPTGDQTTDQDDAPS